jgi:hypothetical protein
MSVLKELELFGFRVRSTGFGECSERTGIVWCQSKVRRAFVIVLILHAP